MKKSEIEKIKQLLNQSKNIVIISHRNPDGDAMGSTLGLYHFLKKTHQNVIVISPNEFPDNLAFLPGSDQVLFYEKNKENCTELLKSADLIFTLDFNDLHRTGVMENVLKELTCSFMMIDHHEFPDNYATITYSDTAFGSTCEMIYNFIAFLDKEKSIDQTIGTCLYTGITTDSGSFRFPKTTPNTHRIVANLLEVGVKNYEVHNALFDNNSYNRLQILGKALQNMKVFPELKTAYIYLSQEELDAYNYVKGDTEGIVNYALSIKEIIFAVIFIENKEENIIKISLRSIGNFDVNVFSRTYFSGGGHANASGGKSTESLTKTIAYFEDIIKNHPNLK